MSLLVLGSSGQVAQEAAGLGLACYGRAQGADFTQAGAVAELIAEKQPQAVINAAAYTAVDKAEDEEALALLVNGTAVKELAQACAIAKIPLVHISTDYVFDGAGEAPWRPEDATNPLGAYGRSKLAGEEAVQAAGGTYAILRTSWVFSSHGNNFVKTMLRLGRERDSLSVVADQWGGPTPAGAIAKACLQIAETLIADPSKSGTYHFAGKPITTWHGFACETFAQAGLSVDVSPIPSEVYPTPAARPKNSRMDCSSLEAAFGIAPPDWQQALTQIIKDLS